MSNMSPSRLVTCGRATRNFLDGESLLAPGRAGPAEARGDRPAYRARIDCSRTAKLKGFGLYETIQRSFPRSRLSGLWRYRLPSPQAAHTTGPQDLPAALQAMFWQGAGKEGAVAGHAR